MKPFSWKQAKIDGLALSIRQAKIKAKNKTNPTFNTEHADECSQAQSNLYTKLVSRITLEHDKLVKRHEDKIKKIQGIK